jgi:hypothetical protein
MSPVDDQGEYSRLGRKLEALGVKVSREETKEVAELEVCSFPHWRLEAYREHHPIPPNPFCKV